VDGKDEERMTQEEMRRHDVMISYSKSAGFGNTQTHITISTRLKLKCDGTRCRTGGEMSGKLANRVGSEYSSHYLGT